MPPPAASDSGVFDVSNIPAGCKRNGRATARTTAERAKVTQAGGVANHPRRPQTPSPAMSADLAATIDAAWEDRAGVNAATRGALREAVDEALSLLDSGQARVAEKADGAWRVNQCLKKAVRRSFRLNDSEVIKVTKGEAT